MWSCRVGLAVKLFAGLLSMTGCGDGSDDGLWQGRIEVVDGVSRIMSEVPIRHAPDKTVKIAMDEDLVIDSRTELHIGSVFGITTDRYGNIFVADATMKRILKFSEDGTFLASVGSEGAGPLQFKSPVDMALDKADKLYIVDSKLNRVTVLNPDMTFLDLWNTQVVKPRRIRIDAEGNVLLFAITQHDLIYKFRPDGNFIDSFYNPMESLRRMGALEDLIAYSDAAMETTKDGYVVVSAKHPYWIRKFDRVNGLELEINRATPFEVQPLKSWGVEPNPPPVGYSGSLALLPDGRIMNIIQYQEFEQIGLNALGMPQVKLVKSQRWYDFFTPGGKWEMTAQPDTPGLPMHVDRKGRLYFHELENDRIVRYTISLPEGRS